MTNETIIDRSGRVRRRAALGMILLIAAALRVNHVRQPLTDVFSWRQASTAMMADNFYRVDRNIFFPQVSWTGPGPSYQGREFQTVSYTASLLYRVFGQRDWIGRGISIVFSLWGVFALFQLTRRVWDEQRALATALMYAVLPGAIFIDRSFLPDPAMLALTVTALWAYVAYLQTSQTKCLVASGIVGVFAFLTKLPGIIAIVPAVYATISILRSRNALNQRSLSPIFITLVLGLIPVAFYYAWAIHLGAHYPPYHIAGSGNWLWSTGLEKFVAEGFYLRASFKSFRWWFWTPPGIALILFGLVLPVPARGRDGKAPWLFHFWLLGCLVLYVVGARELKENVWNFHVFNVAGAALAGHALITIAMLMARRPHPRRRLAIAWAAAVIVIATSVMLAYGQRRLKTMYKPTHARDSHRLGLALRERTKADDLVVTIADDVGDPIAIYYSQRHGWVFPPAHLPKLWKPWNLMPPDPAVSIAMFEDLRAKGANWLGIVREPEDDRPGKENFWRNHPELIAHINRTCELVEKSSAWVIYRIPPAAAATRSAAPRSGPAGSPSTRGSSRR
jgi:hypothetical protein